MGEHERVSVPLVRPAGLEPGELSTYRVALTKKALDELEAFYREHLAAELICSPDPEATKIPQRTWLEAPGRTVLAARDDLGLAGVWTVRDNAIWYPCIRMARVVDVMRALWAESTKRFDYLTASSANGSIFALASQASRQPPGLVINEHGLEWRRP